MWHVSALYRPCIGHRTGYSLHEIFAHSYKRWRPRLFFYARISNGIAYVEGGPRWAETLMLERVAPRQLARVLEN